MWAIWENNWCRRLWKVAQSAVNRPIICKLNLAISLTRTLVILRCPCSGFIIIPDFKWSGKQIEDLYVIGIVHTKNLKSIRSLRRQHLPLLRKLWMDGTAAIAARYRSFLLHSLKLWFTLIMMFRHLNACPLINLQRTNLHCCCKYVSNK